MSDSSGDEVGKGRPPVASRFKPGQCGNHKGRPRGKRGPKSPYEAILGRMVTIRDDGIERTVRADVAFVLNVVSRGLGGNASMTRLILAALDKCGCGTQSELLVRHVVHTTYPKPGDLKWAANTLGISRMLDPYRPTARLVLEAWAIEQALSRFGELRLSPAEQRVVWDAARNPHKVRWPDWWAVRSD